MPWREARHWKRLGATALCAAALGFLVACPERSLPSQPDSASASASSEAGATSDPRMEVVLPSRNFHNAGEVQRQTNTPGGPVSTPTRTPTSGDSSDVPAVDPHGAYFDPHAGHDAHSEPHADPSGPTVLRLQAQRYTWRWVVGPNGIDSNTITLKSGQTYILKVFDADCPDLVLLPHFFSGNAGLGVNGVQLAYGADCNHLAPDQSQTFTAPVVSGPTNYSFSCMESNCGNTPQHESMFGSIIVVP